MFDFGEAVKQTFSDSLLVKAIEKTPYEEVALFQGIDIDRLENDLVFAVRRCCHSSRSMPDIGRFVVVGFDVCLITLDDGADRFVARAHLFRKWL